MKVQLEEKHFEIVLGDCDQDWTVLVIDDHWDSVADMICGAYDPLSQKRQYGLFDDAIDTTNVEKYWTSRNPGNETFEKSLLIIPAAVSKADCYSKIVFTGFPSDEQAIAALPLSHKQKVAILIDIKDQGDYGKVKFPDTWQILDLQGFPQHTRARFTRGGVQLEQKFDNVEIIVKEAPRGGTNAHIGQLVAWMNRVRGCINVNHHAECTREACHDPLDLLSATMSARASVCAKLLEDDLYGVWRWCSELALQELVPIGAPCRWLAGKAFNSWNDSESAPLLAVIAICEGARHLRVGGDWDYIVESQLGDIPSQHLEESREQSLGVIIFAKGRYHGFAAALREWLVAPDQFKDGSGKIQTIRVNEESGYLLIEFQYTVDLPDVIFNGGTLRVGSTIAAWQRLAAFASSTCCSGSCLQIRFDYRA